MNVSGNLNDTTVTIWVEACLTIFNRKNRVCLSCHMVSISMILFLLGIWGIFLNRKNVVSKHWFRLVSHRTGRNLRPEAERAFTLGAPRGAHVGADSADLQCRCGVRSIHSRSAFCCTSNSTHIKGRHTAKADYINMCIAPSVEAANRALQEFELYTDAMDAINRYWRRANPRPVRVCALGGDV